MIDGAIAGKVCGRPEIRSGKGGKAAVVVRIRAAAAGGEGVQVNVAAYVHEVREVLLSLDDGATVVLQGRITPSLWKDEAGTVKPALEMEATAVLSAHVSG
ncbi:Uncharacterised protein [Ralstonia pickettii]|nr:single-strand binding family protein [Ralstonia pickettii]QQK36970.1 hypothetical protein RP6297_03208 [Ralstonia pickettii]UCA15821.1 single-stranded DNA-binding protein [Ralstonia pickettii]SUE01070.1 Uncharacterised protein [Ralstonia pickettii]